MQNQGQTSSRECGEAKCNCDYGSENGVEKLLFLWRENYGGFRAEVVVFNHPPGSASNPKQDLTGNARFQVHLCAVEPKALQTKPAFMRRFESDVVRAFSACVILVLASLVEVTQGAERQECNKP